MPEHKYPDHHAQGAAAGGHTAEKRTAGLEELDITGDLYENGAYTNGIIGL